MSRSRSSASFGQGPPRRSGKGVETKKAGSTIFPAPSLADGEGFSGPYSLCGKNETGGGPWVPIDTFTLPEAKSVEAMAQQGVEDSIRAMIENKEWQVVMAGVHELLRVSLAEDADVESLCALVL
ncbi:hypothetical protein KIPB_010032, partial [Kipferlia bialata]|eukprot:g10032.t1